MPSRVIHKLMSTSRLHRQFIAEQVACTGVTGAHHRLLMDLHFHPDLTQAQLAQKRDISPAAVASGLRKLEKAGYIRRCPDAADARCNRMILTKRGEAVCLQSVALLNRCDEAVLEGFSCAELEQLEHYFDRMQQNICRCRQSKGDDLM